MRISTTIPNIPNANIVGFCGRNADRAKSLAEKYSCTPFAGYEELLDQNDIDVVTIATASGAHMEPAIAAADNALQPGSVDQLANKVSQAVREGILKRFITTLDKKKHADESVEAGREFVEAYVDYVHFVGGIHQIVSQGIIHHSSERPHGQEHGH